VLQNVGVPVQGVPVGQVAPRIGTCVTGHQVGVIELGWFFDDAQAVDCPGILGGSSGSPLFDRTDQVVGMINTTTAGALPGGECWLGNPCERTDAGVEAVPGTSYAVAVAGLAGCFPDGRFALVSGCPLPPPGVVAAIGVTSVDATHDTVSAELTAPTGTTLRSGVAPLSAADSCADEATYTQTVAAGPTRTTVQATVPEAEGFSVWCLQDPARPEQPAQRMRQAEQHQPGIGQGEEPQREQPQPAHLSRGFRWRA